MLQRLAVIALLKEVGFTIIEISELVRGKDGPQGWRSMAEDKLGEIDAHLERVNDARELLTAALGCRCSGLDTCDLVQARRGRHHKVVQTVALGMGPPANRKVRDISPT